MQERRLFASARAKAAPARDPGEFNSSFRTKPFLAGEKFRETIARTKAIAGRLKRAYPRLKVPLNQRNTFELLVATILSAQCTDEAVNRVTPELFARYPNAETLARALTVDLERIIRPLGLYRAKAKVLKNCSRVLSEQFGGKVPSTMAELTRLAGVGRKTANVIRGHAFHAPAVIVDTHCRRVSRRLGLTRHNDPDKIERDLSRLLPQGEWTGFSHRLIFHGRQVCFARNPRCASCVLLDLCPTAWRV